LTNLGLFVLGFVKGFDASAVETDAANFYMEREWRVLGRMEFKLTDVEQVIMPRPRFKDFRRNVPKYAGELIAALRV
jgi:hypothetical protein